MEILFIAWVFVSFSTFEQYKLKLSLISDIKMQICVKLCLMGDPDNKGSLGICCTGLVGKSRCGEERTDVAGGF